MACERRGLLWCSIAALLVSLNILQVVFKRQAKFRAHIIKVIKKPA